METNRQSVRRLRSGWNSLALAAISLAAPVYSQTADEFKAVPGIGPVYALAMQPDGRVLVLGPYSSNIRLNTDGTWDQGFFGLDVGNSPNSPSVHSLAVQPDCKILVGGLFNSLGGQTRNNIARVNASGAVDTGFSVGANDVVRAMVIQTDGRILVGGSFTLIGGLPRTCIARLNTDGTLDGGFNPVIVGPYRAVYSLAMQTDGKIMVGGYFDTIGGQAHTNIARLNADGTIDSAFNSGTDSYVYSLAVQADGRILAGGWFTTLGGQPRRYIGRLNQDGTLDAAFDPGAGGGYTYVASLALQTDGRILVGGDFTRLGGQSRIYVGRLNADGTLDSGFTAGTDWWVSAVAVQPDGKILVGGGFNTLGGEPRLNLGRLNNTESATQNLSYDGSIITWLRGGTSPEVWATTFDYSSDGLTWTSLGAGSRISGGWQLGGVALAAGGTLRARGHVTGGNNNASSWLVETMIGAPILISQPSSLTVNSGASAIFAVVAGGPEPLSYRWFKDGLALADGANVAGAATPTLTLTNVLKSNQGGYSVMVSNFGGSVISTAPQLTVIDPAITSQPPNLSRESGQSATFSVIAAGTALNYQWRKDGLALAQETGVSLTLTNVQLSDAGNYSVVVSNPYGTLTSRVATLTVNLATLDGNFNPGANYWVSPVAVQADGKLIFGGDFNFVGGQARSRIARMNVDGTLDSGFNPGASDDLYSLAVQPDGKILVGGDFTVLGGQTRRAIGRLNTNGTVDTSFNTTLFNPPPNYSQTARVQAILVQPDGKIVVAGRTTLTPPVGPALTSGYVYRLNTNGTSDSGFSTGGVNGGPVASLALQPDGKILVGGLFSSVGGQTRSRIARLNSNGSLDTTFNPGLGGTSSVTPIALAFALQPDGGIVVGGQFTTAAGQPRTNICRLNADGTLDGAFAPVVAGVTFPSVYSLALQTDGKILVGGIFNTIDGTPRLKIGRLNSDGSVDTAFNPGANLDVYAVAIMSDGKILAGGLFTQLGGQPRSYIGRLNNTEPATQSLSDDGSTITWLRGGTSPEVWRTSFEVSTNGTNWAFLGAGARIAGGWELAGVTLPPDGRIRARGYSSGGGYSASSWFAETISGPCFVISQPIGRTNNAGTVTTFAAYAGGSTPLQYQWLKNGLPLQDAGQITGTRTPTLSLGNAYGPDAGGYSVIVGNSFGSVTSVVATLKIVDPFITTQPASRTNNPNTTASFSVSASGSLPRTFQWRKGNSFLSDGTKISGSETSTLIVSNALGGDAGAYSVIVSNAFGSVTSSVATLKVLDPLIVSHPVSQLATPGQTISFSVTAIGTTPLGHQWRKDGANLTGTPGASLTLANVSLADAGRYDVVVGNVFGNVTSTVAVLAVNLATLDPQFVSEASSRVYSLALRTDGRILAGGEFTTLAGQPRSHIGRLNADGTLDGGFDPGASAAVFSVAMQGDGKTVLAGAFGSVGEEARHFLARLNADGTLDPGFTPGANDYVVTLALQADGRILVGGNFTSLGGQSRNYLARLEAGGTLDSGFNPGASFAVHALAVQADGKILVGGYFTSLGGQPRNRLARLNTNGTLDLGFNPGADNAVISLVVHADGKILVGGYFTSLGGQPRNRLARLNADGTLDPGFNPGANDHVDSLAVQADGKILVGGFFTIVDGQPRNRVARLSADGTLDPSFDPGADDYVLALALQDDGRILLGGNFSTVAGQSSLRIARLENTEPATHSLTYNGSTITWLRGGASPEVWRTLFEVSTNGSQWINLGTGTRIAGGWQLTDVFAPQFCTFRARGFVTGGSHNSSTWFIENTLTLDLNASPKILTSDSDFGFLTNGFGFNVAGLPGQKVVVESSTNLSNWIPLGTNTVTANRFYFSDPGATNFPWRFYRARLQ